MKEILIIWDIDGTLINCGGCGRLAMDKAFCQVFDIENAFEEVKMAGRLDAMIVKDALEIHSLQGRDFTLFFDTYCYMLEDLLQSRNHIEVLPGIKEILERKEENYNICHALGTGNFEKSARIKLNPQDLNKYFLVGGFGDEELERWEIIQKAIEKAEKLNDVKYKKENIFVVGDTPLDIECGKILGIKSVAVSTGYCSPEELIKHEPDYYFVNLENIDEFFKMIQ